MVELDVRHDADLRAEERDRAVGLVALDDEPARACPRVPAELRDDAADDPRRIVAELAEDEGDHRGRRGLPVRAADDDRAPKRDELGEELRARAAFHPARVRGRDDDLEPGRRLRLAADVHLDALERLQEDRLARVPPARLGAPASHDVRVRREPRAADPDEVEAPAGERLARHAWAPCGETASGRTR